jgi:hypothetical protein
MEVNMFISENNVGEYVSPTARFFSVEDRNYSIDCELEGDFIQPKHGR